SDLRHRPPAGARDHRAGGLVLRLSRRLHGRHGGHRADSDGGGVRRLLYALRGARALVAGGPLRRPPCYLYLVRVRLFHGRALAADADRFVVPGAEGNTIGVASATTKIGGKRRSETLALTTEY